MESVKLHPVSAQYLRFAQRPTPDASKTEEAKDATDADREVKASAPNHPPIFEREGATGSHPLSANLTQEERLALERLFGPAVYLQAGGARSVLPEVPAGSILNITA